MQEPSSPGLSAPTPVEFRELMGRFATGVSVMTTVHDGTPHAMTANAVTSVSLDPLLVLVSVERRTVMAERVTASGVFALSFLAASQQELSNRFADPDRPLDERQFAGLATTAMATGAPVLTDGLGWLDCEVWAIHDGGDHLLVLGEVVAMAAGTEVDPLVFYRGGYRRLDAE